MATAAVQLVPGLSIGHADSAAGATGCTVVLCPGGAVGGVAVRGGAPATRETDLLRAEKWVDRVHAVLLTGGSAFGLSAADGVVRWLRERSYGWPTAAGPVPIVPAAALYDLVGPDPIWPDTTLGYTACENASAEWPADGRIGAGRGATVGKVLGAEQTSPGGIGAAGLQLQDGVVVGAIVAVNAVGHVIDPESWQILAGPRLPDGAFGDSVEIFLSGEPPAPIMTRRGHTTIGVIWTNARLDKAGCNRIAGVAHDGLARTIRPAHTLYDGDALFMLSLADGSAPSGNLAVLGVAATEAVAGAVVRAVSKR
jgi:L-aminopeptidase/D-esterase-like protein